MEFTSTCDDPPMTGGSKIAARMDEKGGAEAAGRFLDARSKAKGARRHPFLLHKKAGRFIDA